MTEDEDKKIRVELDHEQKVIRLGCFFYDLKGVLIAEATEEDKKKYYCDRFMTYPIVDDDWAVREDDCLKDGIAALTIGKKGDTIPLIKLSEVLDLNVDERSGDYSDILIDVERHGITVSNRQQDNPQEELPETITLEIDRMKNPETFRVYSAWKGYYIPHRYCHVGKDGKLYDGTEVKENETKGPYSSMVYQLANDVKGLSWFFNNQRLKVRCLAARSYDEDETEADRRIPDDWHPAVKTLEDDVNNEIQRMRDEYPDDYFHSKRPIV